MVFKDRKDAGQKLLQKLKEYEHNKDVIVLGLPRGGVVVAFEIAKGLDAILDIIVTRKIGAPGRPELAIGAIDENGDGIFNDKLITMLNVSKSYIDEEIEKEKKEATRRTNLYRSNRKALDLKNKITILVDDGIATGATMKAAIKSVTKQGAKKVIVAVPTLPSEIVNIIAKMVNILVYLDAPTLFTAVGSFYEIFYQTTDKEVINLMQQAKGL